MNGEHEPGADASGADRDHDDISSAMARLLQADFRRLDEPLEQLDID
jgi:hypothetical protein